MTQPAAGSLRIEIEPDAAAQRLDQALAARIDGLSRVRVQALIRAGHVRDVAGTLVDPSDRIKPGQVIFVELPAPRSPEPQGEHMALSIAFEDEHLIVVDKPAGLVVHPAAGHETGTLVNALIGHCGDSLAGISGVRRPGIVHRIDKDTSGLLVVAKTEAAYHGLQAQFANHGADGGLSRIYTAFAWGEVRPDRGTVDAPLARSTANRLRIAVVKPPAGRRAVTHYDVTARYLDPSRRAVAMRLQVRLETGRTHQIRVHLAHIGHPLLGDKVYGSGFATSAHRLGPEGQAALEDLGRQALHAGHLGFIHPGTGRRVSFDSAPPPELVRLQKALESAS